MSVAILLQQILIIFLEIGTGIVITKIGIMDDKNSKFLSNLVMAVTLPCTLLPAPASMAAARPWPGCSKAMWCWKSSTSSASACACS